LREPTRTSGLPYLCHLNFCGSKAWCLMGCFFVSIPMESKRKAEGSKETTSLTEPIHRHVVTSFDRRPLACHAPAGLDCHLPWHALESTRTSIFWKQGRLLNTSEGFRSAAKDLHAYMGIPRGRSNEVGGAGEGCPAPGSASRSIVPAKCT
jgi:hypothetical protein